MPHIVTTARGKKINMDALKALFPNAVPIVNSSRERDTVEDKPSVVKAVKRRVSRVRGQRPIVGTPAIEPELVSPDGATEETVIIEEITPIHHKRK